MFGTSDPDRPWRREASKSAKLQASLSREIMNRRLLLLSCAVAAAAAQTRLKTGDMAPDFKLPSTTGKPITMGEFRGKKAVVLAFFPAAFTGG